MPTYRLNAIQSTTNTDQWNKSRWSSLKAGRLAPRDKRNCCCVFGRTRLAGRVVSERTSARSGEFQTWPTGWWMTVTTSLTYDNGLLLLPSSGSLINGAHSSFPRAFEDGPLLHHNSFSLSLSFFRLLSSSMEITWLFLLLMSVFCIRRTGLRNVTANFS